MFQSAVQSGPANAALARTLSCAVTASSKPRHEIAAQVGLHRETLARILRGDRPITADVALSILSACDAHPRASLMLALLGQEELAHVWMHNDMGAFLEGFLESLPHQLDRNLGRRVSELRPRWANGTSQLVARLLAKHIDDVANRDIGDSFLN